MVSKFSFLRVKLPYITRVICSRTFIISMCVIWHLGYLLTLASHPVYLLDYLKFRRVYSTSLFIGSPLPRLCPPFHHVCFGWPTWGPHIFFLMLRWCAYMVSPWNDPSFGFAFFSLWSAGVFLGLTQDFTGGHVPQNFVTIY